MNALRIAVLGLALLALPAHAQVSFLWCIDQTQSWTQTYSQGSIQGITYIVSMPSQGGAPGMPDGRYLGWLIAAYQNAANVAILVGMSSSVAKQFQSVSNADALFAQTRPRYHELILVNGSFCPLLAEDAPFSTTGVAIWSR